MKPGKWIAAVLAALLLTACAGGSTSVDREAARARLAKAEAMFQERCRKSGVFIHRTAETVEGVFLLKLRPSVSYGHDQYLMDDPYGSDLIGDGYIETFLRARNEKGFLDPMKPGGYRYVDVIDPKDGKRYRYTGRIDQPWLRDKRYGEWVREFALDRIPAPDPAPRYGGTYDDISTREERDYWIAGSSLRVIDLETREVMAERVGYMMDRGQGSDAGGRTPWLFAAAHACPRFGPEEVGVPRSFYQARQTRNFVERILYPTQEK
jgi:hypothetical protein